MRHKTLSTAIAALLLTFQANGLFADDRAEPSKREQVAAGKGAALFTSGAVAGAIAGGPLGAFIGALGGAFIGEDLQKGARDANALNESQQQLVEFKLELQRNEAKIANLEQAKAQRLAFQVMFTTGSGSLNHNDRQRLISLANYLKTNPELSVHLAGFADPRGSIERNTALSKERAFAVITALLSQGIERERISYTAHGASLSSATPGDYEAYALERRVDIDVVNQEATVAAN